MLALSSVVRPSLQIKIKKSLNLNPPLPPTEEVYNIKNFPTDNSKLAEMEFYLVDDLECDLTVFHPYRTLLTLCKKESEDSATPAEEGEAGELGSGIIGTTTFTGSNSLGVGIGADDGPRYWGTGEGQLELSAGALQTAWCVYSFTSPNRPTKLIIHMSGLSSTIHTVQISVFSTHHT